MLPLRDRQNLSSSAAPCRTPTQNDRIIEMTNPEPAHRDAPTGQQDIAALERHQRHLLYGGGAFLSAVILLIMLASIFLSIDDYKADQLDDFRKAKLALDSVFIQRDAGYVRSLNFIEYAWQNKSADLISAGEKEVDNFVAHDDQAVMQASSNAVPYLVVGSGIENWPREKISRYLGLAEELSMVSGTSITVRGKRPGTMGYFYDPSGALFAFGRTLDGADLHAAADRTDHAALFSNLAAPNIDFNNLQALKELHQGNTTLPFYGTGLPKVLSSLGTNPSTGQPAIVGSLVAMDGDTPIGAFVIYEPIEPFVDQMRLVSSRDMAVITNDGQVVFGTGAPEKNQSVAAAIKPLLVLQPFEDRIVRYRRAGVFFISQRIPGTSWMLVRGYGWADILQGEKWPFLTTIALAILMLAALWLLLTRQDRSVFAPALALAKRVYQSEELNRTMIETSPIGLCVIGLDNAAPLLQNDAVRGFAIAIPDSDATLYRQVLREYAHATEALSGRPDAREFELALPSHDGDSDRHLLIAAMPIIYQNRAALFCAFRDVTARREIQENLRKAREDSEQAKLAAESASRAKTAFVATMSHEIRTPLNGILGHLELLGRSKLDPSQHERLERIRFSADTLLSIISDVLDFSRIEAGQLDIDPVSFEIRPLIEQVALLYAPAAEHKGLKLYYGIDADLAEAYIADVHRIRQVLNNLISNAVKFTESGRVILRARSVSPSGSEIARLRFEVIDSGIGMTEEQRGQIFQPFSQADASISRRFGGSGLGLTLCQQISELMGGSIDVQSTQGVGSVFAFELPVAVDELHRVVDPHPLAKRRVVFLSAAAEWRTEITALLTHWGARLQVATKPSEVDAEWLKQADALVIFGKQRPWDEEEERRLVDSAKRVVLATADGPLLPEVHGSMSFISCYSSEAILTSILGETVGAIRPLFEEASPETAERDSQHRSVILLVDDNPVNRELIQQQLETLGYTVDTAEDGVAALHLWRDGRYSAVLTDINMPNMNGYELAKELRGRGVKMPVLAVTATALASEKIQCKRAGITDLLLKPLSLETLGEALLQHLPSTSHSDIPATSAPWKSKYPEKVCRVFVESGTRDLNAILLATQEHDEEGLLARIHSLKGALLMLGEKNVADLCVALEKLIESEGIEAAASSLEKLESEMRELLQRYAEACGMHS
jgi:two-component system capsular synthesis sensor histidine kinase RcsC